jgi:hypothetical protein
MTAVPSQCPRLVLAGILIRTTVITSEIAAITVGLAMAAEDMAAMVAAAEMAGEAISQRRFASIVIMGS